MAELLMGHFEEGDEDDDEDDEADDPDFDPAEGGERGPEELDPRELVRSGACSCSLIWHACACSRA